jgi:hypothetical protein
MEKKEIQERNEYIALMLGYVNTTPTDNDFNIYENNKKTFIHIPKMIETMSMRFHSDWNMLMEVVEFIRLQNFSYDMYCPNGIGEDSDGEFECNFWDKINSDESIGSVNNLRTLNTKMIVGHHHVPTNRKDGICILSLGTNTKLRLSYGEGSSSWIQPHKIIGRSKTSLKEAIFIAVSNFAKFYNNK